MGETKKNSKATSILKNNPLTSIVKGNIGIIVVLIIMCVAVALATDLNPGSCFSGSIPLTIALACIYMKLSIEETITALTLNGAAALQRADRIGSIEVGKQGDFVLLNSDNYHILPYYIGMNCVIMTIKGGILYPVA